MTELVRRARSHADALVLALLVAFSTVRYVTGLGFYSDDWAFLQLMYSSPDQSFGGLVSALYRGDVVIQQRPVQVVFLAALYALFDLNPLGYHLANSCVLIAMAVTFYLILRELRVGRLLAFSIPVTYALLPHYSTDRFWVAAFQAPLSILFYFLSLYAALRSERSHRGSAAAWVIASAVSAAASVLAYEVTLPLLLLTPAVVGLYRYTRPDHGSRQRVCTAVPWLLTVATAIALGAAVAFKLWVSVRVGVGVEGGLVPHAAWLATGALQLNFGTYGVGLPYLVLWIGRFSRDWPTIVLSGVCFGLIYWYVLHLVRQERSPMVHVRSSRYATVFVIVGFVVFGLGYVIFLSSGDVWFTSTSLGNRINIAAAIGVATCFIGTIGWTINLVPCMVWRERLMAGSVAMLCGVGILITNTLGGFWVDAYQQQERITANVVSQLGELPPQRILLLDGVCLERGGAYVFTGQRDLAGRLRIIYDDPSLWATAPSQPPVLEEDYLVVHTYETDVYSYDDKLVVYDYRTGRVYPLSSREVAQQYYDTLGFNHERECPPGFAWGWGENTLR